WNPYGTGALDFTPAGLSNVIAISSYGSLWTDIAAVLTADGRLVIWTNNVVITNLLSVSNAIHVEASHMICFLLMKDGRLHAVPFVPDPGARMACSNLNQLSGLTNVVAVEAPLHEPSLWLGPRVPREGVFCALQEDGKAALVSFYYTNRPATVTAWGVSNLICAEATDDYPVILAGNGKPAFRIQPRNLILGAGAPAELHARAVGPGRLVYQWYHNNKPILGATNADLTIPAVSGKSAGTYFAVVQNAFGATTSMVATLTVITECAGELSAALNAPGLIWQTTTNAPWFAQNLEAHDLNCAAQSGAVAHNQSSALWTTAEGPGRISFWWRVSSEEWFDTLRFELDGMNMARISGEVDWQFCRYRLDPGLHILRWVYAKDATVSAGA
ncbi:MAG: immunoglobulin domain-containing protein, partial [Verrucomicrobiae bacterium]|nr:immunoglobulin domain-containing protein [Verrucomicrobiae bacterium]